MRLLFTLYRNISPPNYFSRLPLEMTYCQLGSCPRTHSTLNVRGNNWAKCGKKVRKSTIVIIMWQTGDRTYQSRDVANRWERPSQRNYVAKKSARSSFSSQKQVCLLFYNHKISPASNIMAPPINLNVDWSICESAAKCVLKFVVCFKGINVQKLWILGKKMVDLKNVHGSVYTLFTGYDSFEE